MSQPTSPPGAAIPGAWSPLTQPVFRNLWLAVLVGNIGTWIHDVSAACNKRLGGGDAGRAQPKHRDPLARKRCDANHARNLTQLVW